MYINFTKPFCDFVFALLLTVALSPLILLTAILLATSQKGNIWFVQRRPGKDGKIFRLIKFKSMNDKVDQNGNLLGDEDRLTPVGKWIRKMSLDELPQMFNILKGDMSFVGPRPLLVEYLPRYNQEQQRRHKVRPGITGWAQVNGRNLLAWKERFEYDTWYVDHISFWLDMKILLLTIVKVLRAEGIKGDNSMTMEKFKGNE